mgnify:CR=1 FL=1|jgi:hypothetical protein
MVDRLNMLMESRIHGDVYVRFGGEFLETYRSNTTRRRVLSLRLKSQYLFIFAGGLLALFVLFIIMYMVGINQWVCIIFGVTSATLLVWLTFRLNEKYGTHGLMKLSARKSHPFHIINRKAISRLFTKNQKQASK